MVHRCCYRWERVADSGSGDGACGAAGAGAVELRQGTARNQLRDTLEIDA